MVDFTVQGFNTDGIKFNGGEVFNMSQEGKVDRYKTGPDDKYATAEWDLEHHITVKQIPGKDNRDITIRTSDTYGTSTGPLWGLNITQFCVGKPFFDKIREMVQIGGPYKITSLFDTMEMYIFKASFKQDSGFAEDPGTIDPDSDVKAAVGTWTITFKQYNKGIATDGAPSTIPVIAPLPVDNSA